MINEKTHNTFLAILIIIILGLIMITSDGCDNRLGKPDIHPENKKGDMYFGWKWDLKW